MQCDALHSSNSTAHPLEVQVPSLAGISIPPMKGELHSISSNSGWKDTQRHLRPTLQRIDTEVAAPRLPVIVDQRSSRHTPPHSQDYAADYYGTRHTHGLRPRGRSDLLMPISADARRRSDVLPAEHARPRRRGTVSSVPGPYISFASRGNTSAGTSVTSGSPSLYTPSPLSPSPSAPSPDADIADEAADGEEEIDPEDAWNLIPYHIPWGSSYHGYKGGTLPGPDGKCLFLRSPTPLKNQRTGQACEKCRERKAKCSGTRPSCARCIARGHVCEYGPEIKRSRNGSRGGEVNVKEEEEEEEEEEDTRSPSRSRSRSDTRSPTLESSPECERRKTIADVRTTVAIPPPPMLRRHSAIDGPSSPYNRKKRKAPIRPRRSTMSMECSDTPKSVIRHPLSSSASIFSANGHSRLGNAPSPSSASEAPSEPESLPDSASPSLLPHPMRLSSYGSETLSHYRFPDSPSSAGEVEYAHGRAGVNHHNDMDLDIELAHQFPMPVSVPDLPTPMPHTHLHAPNPLRYSVSMPQLPHVQMSQVHSHSPTLAHEQTHHQSQMQHQHQHHHGAENYMYYPNTNGGYNTSTTGSTADGTDLDYEFMSSPVVMQSWIQQRTSSATSSEANSSEFGLEPLPPIMSGHNSARLYSFDSAQSSTPSVCSDFHAYHGVCGDASQHASALVLLEELNLQRNHISNPFNPVAEWTTA